MTPLKPLENRRVRGVASERYPLNTICAHPECLEPTADPHHCFPRSQIIGDSWFVSIEAPTEEKGWPVSRYALENVYGGLDALPHVAGLCRAHHDDVEEHRAWIRLIDGEFVWYEREEYHPFGGSTWLTLGALNPQPGSREGKPKRKKFMGEKKRQSATWTIRCPKDSGEDGIAVLKVLVEECRVKTGRPEGTPPYFTLTESLYGFLQTPS